MKLTLIYVAALLLVSSQVVLAADKVPNFDISRSCRNAGAEAGVATRDRATCEHSENNARAAIEKEWGQVTPSDKEHCARLMTLGGSPSYVELLTCLEMAKATKERPTDQMDSGKPVEKSRRAK